MAWWRMNPWRRPRGSPPPTERRTWVHPSELPSFAKLPTSAPRVRSARPVIVVAAILALVGSSVLMVNRSHAVVSNNPAHLAASLTDLPAVSRLAAAHLVDLAISTPGHVDDVPALVLANNLAVTTTKIPVNALLTGSTANHVNFPVTLVGRDNVMDFSIVHLGLNVAEAHLDALPAAATVTAVAPIERGSTTKPSFKWSITTLGDPSLNSHGVVHYLATKSDTSMSDYVDAIAVDSKGQVVAVLSSQHLWYPATFVARVATVVATGRGCHANLGVRGASAQGGGVSIANVVPYSPGAHAGLRVGDVVTSLNGTQINSWNDLASTLYLTPAYSRAQLIFERGGHLHHAVVSLNCDL
ncbi:MAG TPA: PDZ domain-containing protein [Acidimicrobiales bacterium]|nr:PDZ domain-containing protein [Acidimicrobiales bacterium]